MSETERPTRRYISFNWCSPCLNGRHLGRDHEGRYCECRCKTAEREETQP